MISEYCHAVNTIKDITDASALTQPLKGAWPIGFPADFRMLLLRATTDKETRVDVNLSDQDPALEQARKRARSK
jgi:hypothetical protein